MAPCQVTDAVQVRVQGLEIHHYRSILCQGRPPCDGDRGRKSGQYSDYLTVNHGGLRVGFTAVVNGLVCFYDRNGRSFSTVEAEAYSYHFGFDPVSALYRLLKICPVYIGHDHETQYQRSQFARHLECEILIIGVDSSWRIINAAPPVPFTTRGDCCLDGVLYWTEPVGSTACQIIAFHLAEGNFQVIPQPQQEVSSTFSMPRFAPGPALPLIYHLIDRDVQRASMFHRRRGSPREGESAEGGEGAWVDDHLRFDLPKTRHCGLRFEGILPNGKVLISDDKSNTPRLVIFDPVEREFKVNVIQAAPSCGGVYSFAGPCFYYEENIIPLRSLSV